MIGDDDDDDNYEIKCHPMAEMLTIIVTDALPRIFDCIFHDGPEFHSQKGEVPGSMPGLPQPRLQVVLIACPCCLNLLIVGDAWRHVGVLVHSVERGRGTVMHGFARSGFTQREWPLHGRAWVCTIRFHSKRMAVAWSCMVLHDQVSLKENGHCTVVHGFARSGFTLTCTWPNHCRG